MVCVIVCRLESIGQLFESKTDLEFFCSLVMRLKIIHDITSMEKQAILAYIILFNMSDDETVCHISKVFWFLLLFSQWIGSGSERRIKSLEQAVLWEG